MADFSKFRTSLGGFNRNDVSDYMTKICAEHQVALKQQQKETAELADKLDDAYAQLNKAKQDLEERDAVIRTLREELEAAEALLSSDAEPAEETPDYASMELEAYRRAEATERLAAERSAKLRQQFSDLLDTAARRYEEAGEDVSALADDIRSNLKRLEEVLADLNAVFDETADGLDALDKDEPITI